MSTPPTMSSPLSVTPTKADPWAVARVHAHLVQQHASRAVEHAMACGLELLKIRDSHPELRGGNRHSEQKAHDALFAREGWYEVVQREVGVAKDTARRWMLLAKGWLARRELDQAGYLALPDAERDQLAEEARADASRHATQLDFLRELYGVRPPPGHGLDDHPRGYARTRRDGSPRAPKRNAAQIEAEHALAQFAEKLAPTLDEWLAADLYRHLDDGRLLELHHMLLDLHCKTGALLSQRGVRR